MNLSTELKSLIINSAIVAFGSFMVTPFLGVFLKNTLHIETRTVGLLIALSTLIQFGGGVLGAMLAERMGLKKAMVFSLSFRTLGFILLGLSTKWLVLITPAVFLVAAGSAVYLPANRAYIILSVSSDLKPLFLSVSNAALSIGMAMGPLVAGLLMDKNPSQLFYFVAILFIVLAVIHQVTLSSDSNKKFTSFAELPGAIVEGGKPIMFSTLTFYLYFFFQSFMALYMSSIAHPHLFSLIMILNLLTIFFVQPLLARRVSKMGYRNLLMIGFALMGMGFFLFSTKIIVNLFIGTFIMTLGQSLLVLRGDLEVLQRLPQQAALAFGIQRLTTGVGGMVAGLMGGVAFDYFLKFSKPELFWVFVAVNCFIGALISYIYSEGQEVSHVRN